MLEKLLLNLQLFGEGGDGGDGGSAVSTGGNEIDTSGEKIPASIPEKAKKYYQKAMEKTAANKAASNPLASDKAQTANEPKATTEKIPQHKAALETLSPMLKHLAKEKGLDPENIDHTALVNAVTGVYANKALELGVSEDTARMLDQQQRNLDQQKMQNHILKLEQQGNVFKAIVPNFDLRTEMQNPIFARLTSPSVGLSVEDAFYAVHRKEMQQQSMQVAAQQAQQMISNAIQSGTNRPDESGTASQAPSVSRFDYKNATPAQRKALKDEIRRAAPTVQRSWRWRETCTRSPPVLGWHETHPAGRHP